jgi:hypothetical protein
MIVMMRMRMTMADQLVVITSHFERSFNDVERKLRIKARKDPHVPTSQRLD